VFSENTKMVLNIKKFDKRSRPVMTKTVLKHTPTPPLGVGFASLGAQVGVGLGVASFWRGAWYILDDNLFPDNPMYSATACLGLGTAGLAATQMGIARLASREVSARNKVKLPSYYNSLARFGSLYGVAISVVLVWRGSWMMWDVGYEHYHQGKVKATDTGHLTNSGLASHVLAIGGLLAFGRFSSVLAPPASVSILKDLALKASTWKEYSAAAKWFFR